MTAAVRRLVAIAALAAFLALAGAAVADHVPSEFEDKPRLAVSFPDDRDHSLVLALDVAELEQRPGRVAVVVPSGFDLDAQRPAGTTVGSALLFAADVTDTSFGISLLEGEIVAEAPTAPVDPACDRGARLGVWAARFQLFGEPVELPIVVRAPVAGEAGEQVLEICAPRLPSGNGARLPIVGLYLVVVEVGTPSTAGRYDWRAFVDPLAEDRRTFGAGTYEVQSAVPVPHGLTLSVRYSRATRTATVRGRLSGAGRARAGVPVTLVAYRRGARPSAEDRPPQVVGTKRTDANGRVAFRLRTGRETVFRAYVEEQVTACRPPSDAPGGCASSTTSGVASEPVSAPLASGKNRRP